MKIALLCSLLLLFFFDSVHYFMVYCNEPMVAQHTFFTPLRAGEPSEVIFHIKNTSKQSSTIAAKILSKDFPEGDNENWFVKFCYSGMCFYEEGESTVTVQPGETIEMRFGIWPEKNAKMNTISKVIMEIYPKKAEKLKEILTFYSMCVNPKEVKLTIGNKEAQLNHEIILLDAAPFIESGRTMVPLRFISESIGTDVMWDPKNEKITLQMNLLEIEFWIGKREIIKRIGKDFTQKINTDTAPVIKNNRTFVPLRVIAEILGCKVSYDSDTGNIVILFPVPSMY